MISERDVRAQQAHCRDLLREAERDRSTYGAWLNVTRKSIPHWAMRDLQEMDRPKIGLALTTGLGVLLIVLTYLIGGAPGLAGMLP
ncbi:MAG: hypothetical protein M1132_12040 [Chloroflexi bacterium]|nr:hypothetical protein [Chloroflexota bacterium]MCL5952428.1 hypothetical protein [Chloroflexota bacterium]